MRRSAFTMLELLFVVVLLGGVALLVVLGVTRSSEGVQRKRAVEAVHMALLHARVDAMQSGAETWVRLEFRDPERLVISRDEGSELDLPAPALTRHILRVPAGPNSLPDAYTPLVARFLPTGRTDQREWAFGLRDSADTLWTIRFDPLSGAPGLLEGETPDPAAESAVLSPSMERRP